MNVRVVRLLGGRSPQKQHVCRGLAREGLGVVDDPRLKGTTSLVTSLDKHHDGAKGRPVHVGHPQAHLAAFFPVHAETIMGSLPS